MSTTAQWVFETAMHLMDQVDPAAGVETADTREYRLRTLPILNLLCAECYPYSETCPSTVDGKRPVCPAVEDWQQELPLDEFFCRAVLPCGLAAHLLTEENPSSAAFFLQRYEQMKLSARRGGGALSEAITDCYGGVTWQG